MRYVVAAFSAAAVLAVAGAILIYVWSTTTPEHTVLRAAIAVVTHNNATFDEWCDLHASVESLLRAAAAYRREASFGLENPERDVGLAPQFAAMLRPDAGPALENAIRDWIATGEFKPELALIDPADWDGFVAIFRERVGGRDHHFEGLVTDENDGERALVRLTYWLHYRPIVFWLSMRRHGLGWRIDGIRNFFEALEQIDIINLPGPG